MFKRKYIIIPQDQPEPKSSFNLYFKNDLANIIVSRETG